MTNVELDHAHVAGPTRAAIAVVGMAGAFQCDNALLALTAAEAFVGSAIPDAVVAAAGTHGLVVATGSLYLISPLRNADIIDVGGESTRPDRDGGG